MPEMFDDAVDLMRALASGPRLRIMCSLLDGPQNVTEICERLAMSQSGVSQHLGRLRTQGLVVSERHGQFVQYALPANVTREVIAFLDLQYGIRAGAESASVPPHGKSSGKSNGVPHGKGVPRHEARQPVRLLA